VELLKQSIWHILFFTTSWYFE